MRFAMPHALGNSTPGPLLNSSLVTHASEENKYCEELLVISGRRSLVDLLGREGKDAVHQVDEAQGKGRELDDLRLSKEDVRLGQTHHGALRNFRFRP